MKLKALNFSYHSAKAFESFTVDVQINQDGDFFIRESDIPKEVLTVGYRAFEDLEKKRGKWVGAKTTSNLIYVKSLDRIKDAIQKCIEVYEEQLVDSEFEKVIKYEFNLSGLRTHAVPHEDPEKEVDATYFGQDASWSRRMDRARDLQIEFKWEVLKKITNKSIRDHRRRSIIYLSLDDSETYVGEEDKVVPWSEAREEWFVQMEEQMRQLMFKLEDFMKIDQKKLVAAIDEGKPMFPLLLGKK
jgi:hypothetical protein